MYSLSWLALKSFNFLSEIFGFHQLRQRYFERCKFSLFQVYDNFDWLRVTARVFFPIPISIQSTQFLFRASPNFYFTWTPQVFLEDDEPPFLIFTFLPLKKIANIAQNAQFLYHLYSPGILRGRRAPWGEVRPTSEQFRTANSIATLPPGISVSLLSSK